MALRVEGVGYRDSLRPRDPAGISHTLEAGKETEREIHAFEWFQARRPQVTFERGLWLSERGPWVF